MSLNCSTYSYSRTSKNECLDWSRASFLLDTLRILLAMRLGWWNEWMSGRHPIVSTTFPLCKMKLATPNLQTLYSPMSCVYFISLCFRTIMFLSWELANCLVLAATKYVPRTNSPCTLWSIHNSQLRIMLHANKQMHTAGFLEDLAKITLCSAFLQLILLRFFWIFYTGLTLYKNI